MRRNTKKYLVPKLKAIIGGDSVQLRFNVVHFLPHRFLDNCD